MSAPRQMPLAFDYRPALGRSAFLVAPSNTAAVQAVGNWRAWPGRRMALTGPARSGKTHLAHVWMQETGARRVEAAALARETVLEIVAEGHGVIEDADRLARLEQGPRRAAEEALFHLMNLAANDGVWLLITGRGAPARWPVATPDLGSRLAALPLTALAGPDDMLLSSLMVKLFADRQLQVGPEVIQYLASRIERSCAAAEAVVTELDRMSLARRRRVSRAMAIELMASKGKE